MADGISYFHCRPRTRRKQKSPDILEENGYTFATYPCHGSSEMCTTVSRWCPGSVLVILSFLSFICDPVSANSCATEVGQCWDSYQIHSQKFGLGSEFSSVKAHCTALRTYMQCLEKLRGCSGNIEFHTSKRLVRDNMKKNKCLSTGPTYNGNNVYETVLPPDELCSFKGKQVYKHCGLFGDPHIQTFSNQLQTCRVKGAWPLVNNEHFTVQVTNDPVSNSMGATATSKLTVIIKKNVVCASNRYIMYQAQSGYLPGTFDDGQTYFGKSHSVELLEIDPGKHIEIKLKYIDTSIVVRQVGVYFTFALNMPEELLNSSESITQLCVHGCPENEKIDYEGILISKEEEIRNAKVLMPRDEALEKCREARLTDFFLDACVFDLMMTGNDTFAKAANYTFQDILKLDPGYPRTQANRTDLPEPRSSARSSSHQTCVIDLVQLFVLTFIVCFLITHRTALT